MASSTRSFNKTVGIFRLSPLCLPHRGLHSQAGPPGGQDNRQRPQISSPKEREHFFPSGSSPRPSIASHWLIKITYPSLNQSLWLEGCLHPLAAGLGHIPTMDGVGGQGQLLPTTCTRSWRGVFLKGKLVSEKGRGEAGRQR